MGKGMRFIDLHCDTIVCEVHRWNRELRNNPEGHLDLLRMQEGRVLMQCMALFIPTPSRDVETKEVVSPWMFFNQAADCYDRQLEKNSDLILPALTVEDIEKNAAAGKMSAMLTVEDGVPLEGKIERLDEMFRRGVRIITLTWNHENSLGYPNCSAQEKGLKSFGIEAVHRMNELGIVADCSHLSDGGFWDLVKYSQKPFVATHSNARAQSNVLRNLTDEMLRALADKGGVTGLNYCAHFLTKNSRHTYISDIVRHAEHIANVAGVETLALGSDFDGIGDTLEFKDVAGVPLVEEALNRVFTAREVDLITHENAMRVLRDCIGK